jgi:hypothetical protein
MPHPIQQDELAQVKGAISQALANLAIAMSAYSLAMLTTAAVQAPNGSGDKGYVHLHDAEIALEQAQIECVEAIFARIKFEGTVGAAGIRQN